MGDIIYEKETFVKPLFKFFCFRAEKQIDKGRFCMLSYIIKKTQRKAV